MIPFWKHHRRNRELSQWYPSEFKLTPEILMAAPMEIQAVPWLSCNKVRPLMNNTFSCAEQFMMAAKAILFGDDFHFEVIMNSDHPAVMKQLGSKVRNFDQHIWNIYCQDIVTVTTYLKFTQTPTLKEFLLNTGDCLLVEASPLDPIWGAGVDENDPRIHDPAQWPGSNLLGECLMKVRTLL